MNSLSPRLEYVTTQFLPNQPVWDFCCDHGYLGIWALKNHYPEVHFVDQASHLIDAIEARAEAFKEENKNRIFFHRVAGQNIPDPVQGNITILGVGPHTIKEILEGLWQKQNLKTSRLILGPQKNPEKLESWIQTWQKTKSLNLIHKKTIQEKSRERIIYTIDHTN